MLTCYAQSWLHYISRNYHISVNGLSSAEFDPLVIFLNMLRDVHAVESQDSVAPTCDQDCSSWLIAINTMDRRYGGRRASHESKGAELLTRSGLILDLSFKHDTARQVNSSSAVVRDQLSWLLSRH